MAVKPKGKPKGVERDFATSQTYAEAMDEIASGADPFAQPDTTVFQAAPPPLTIAVVRTRRDRPIRVTETHGRIDEKAAQATLANLKKLLGFEPPEE